MGWSCARRKVKALVEHRREGAAKSISREFREIWIGSTLRDRGFTPDCPANLPLFR
jgi:hypothetical protein